MMVTVSTRHFYPYWPEPAWTRDEHLWPSCSAAAAAARLAAHKRCSGGWPVEGVRCHRTNRGRDSAGERPYHGVGVAQAGPRSVVFDGRPTTACPRERRRLDPGPRNTPPCVYFLGGGAARRERTRRVGPGRTAGPRPEPMAECRVGVSSASTPSGRRPRTGTNRPQSSWSLRVDTPATPGPEILPYLGRLRQLNTHTARGQIFPSAMR